jgi:hypothetical protein
VYRQWQPFGQVPAFRDGELELFESGAIVLHIACKSDALAPRDAAGRARVTTWVIAALNSLEPYVQNFVALDVFHAGEAWVEGYRPHAQALLEKRLNALAGWLDGKEVARGEAWYNYETRNIGTDELSGRSVFYKNERGEIFHTYSSFGRGGEDILNTYRFLDMVPKGRNEGPGENLSHWVRHHDRYASGPDLCS